MANIGTGLTWVQSFLHGWDHSLSWARKVANPAFSKAYSYVRYPSPLSKLDERYARQYLTASHTINASKRQIYCDS